MWTCSYIHNVLLPSLECDSYLKVTDAVKPSGPTVFVIYCCISTTPKIGTENSKHLWLPTASGEWHGRELWLGAAVKAVAGAAVQWRLPWAEDLLPSSLTLALAEDLYSSPHGQGCWDKAVSVPEGKQSKRESVRHHRWCILTGTFPGAVWKGLHSVTVRITGPLWRCLLMHHKYVPIRKKEKKGADFRLSHWLETSSMAAHRTLGN